jgi:hypothetical protein
MTEAWLFAGVVFVVWMLSAFLVGWVRDSLLHGRGLPWRILLKRAEEDPYFNREYARPKKPSKGE